MKIEPQLKSLISPLRPDELQALEQSLKTEGCRDALVVWKEENILLDGHNRHHICTSLGIPYRITEISLPSILASKIWIRENQMARRNLTDDQRAMNAVALEELYSEQARIERATTAGKTGGRGRPKDNSLLDTSASKLSDPKQWSRTKAAKTSKVSERKMRSAKKVAQASPELAASVAAGTISMARARAEIKQQERRELASNPVDGKFQLILADPPWQYGNSGFDESANSLYPTMSTDELCSMSAQLDEWSSPSTVLFLWATNPMLPDALMVMRAWGFSYRTNLAWVKDRGRGKGWFLKSRHELLLIGVKSHTPHPSTRPDSAFFADRPEQHSQKPEQSYEIIENMYLQGPRLEMFSRKRRPGWEAHGNQLGD